MTVTDATMAVTDATMAVTLEKLRLSKLRHECQGSNAGREKQGISQVQYVIKKEKRTSEEGQCGQVQLDADLYDRFYKDAQVDGPRASTLYTK